MNNKLTLDAINENEQSIARFKITVAPEEFELNDTFTMAVGAIPVPASGLVTASTANTEIPPATPNGTITLDTVENFPNSGTGILRTGKNVVKFTWNGISGNQLQEVNKNTTTDAGTTVEVYYDIDSVDTSYSGTVELKAYWKDDPSQSLVLHHASASLSSGQWTAADQKITSGPAGLSGLQDITIIAADRVLDDQGHFGALAYLGFPEYSGDMYCLGNNPSDAEASFGNCSALQVVMDPYVNEWVLEKDINKDGKDTIIVNGVVSNSVNTIGANFPKGTYRLIMTTPSGIDFGEEWPLNENGLCFTFKIYNGKPYLAFRAALIEWGVGIDYSGTATLQWPGDPTKGWPPVIEGVQYNWDGPFPWE